MAVRIRTIGITPATTGPAAGPARRSSAIRTAPAAATDRGIRPMRAVAAAKRTLSPRAARDSTTASPSIERKRSDNLSFRGCSARASARCQCTFFLGREYAFLHRPAQHKGIWVTGLTGLQFLDFLKHIVETGMIRHRHIGPALRP